MARPVRYIIFLLLMAVSSSIIHAETVKWKETERIAETFFNAAYGHVMAKPKLVYTGKNLTTDRLFTPFYVFNHPSGGFVIISADNKALPILGYSLKSTFSQDKLTPEKKRMLADYAKEIEYIRYDSRQPDEAIEAWGDINGSIDHALNRYFRDNSFARIENEEDGSVWIMRGNATEFPDIIRQDAQILTDEIEDKPFEFYDSFISQTRADAQKRLDDFDARLTLNEPKLKWIGGGHFEVQIPSEIRMIRLYNMDGALIRMLTFRNTETAKFDLDNQPQGFYFALVNDNQGKSYSFKLYK